MNFLVGNVVLVVLLVLLEYYFFRKIHRSLKYLFSGYAKLRIKALRIMLLIFLNAYPLYATIYFQYYNLRGETGVRIPQSNLMDYILVYPFWIFLLIIIQCTLIYLLLDLVRLVSEFFHLKSEKTVRYSAVLNLITCLLFIIYVPSRIYHDSNYINVREIIYNIRSEKNDLNNFRLTFISDIQADRYTDEELLQSYIQKVNATNPDLVLIAGDLITSTPQYIQTAAKWTGRIKAKYGVYSCVGDHDNWAYRNDYARSLTEISTALSERHVKMIDNGNIFFQIRDSRIVITFITNTYVGGVSQPVLDSLSKEAQAADFKIFLTHQPRQKLVSEAMLKKYDLMLAGHTHGGQITFLFPFKLLSPTLFETKYVRGDYLMGRMLLVVCRGLGVSILPVRYNSTPEIISIRIRTY